MGPVSPKVSKVTTVNLIKEKIPFSSNFKITNILYNYDINKKVKSTKIEKYFLNNNNNIEKS
jgi:hypothetical protein